MKRFHLKNKANQRKRLHIKSSKILKLNSIKPQINKIELYGKSNVAAIQP